MEAAGTEARAGFAALSGRPRWALIGLIALGFATTLAYLLSSISSFGGDLLYEDKIGDVYFGDVYYIGTVAIGAIACLTRVALVKADRGAWLLIGLGACAWVAGEVGFAIQLNADGRPAYPSTADGLFLLQYPLTLAGIWMLVRHRFGARDPRRWLDGAIAASASAALGVALLGPALSDLGARRMAATLTNLSYPIADIIMIAVIFGAIGFASQNLDRGLVLLLAAFAAVAAADGIFLYLDSTGGYYDVDPVDALWMLGAVLLALAAIARPAPIRHRGAPPALILPLGLALAALAVVTLTGGSEIENAALYLAVVTIAAMVARLLLALSDVERLLARSRHEADTDALTGLANRRSLMTELDVATTDALAGGPAVLVAIYDLDGFKAYNDSFGHAAGDGLLRRCGRNLQLAIQDNATAYRLGGDEFCVIGREGRGQFDAIVAAGSAALSERGQGFSIGSSVGTSRVPGDAVSVGEALQVADRRMYAAKGTRVDLPELQARNLLMQVLNEREPDLGTHMRTVCDLADGLARAAGLGGEDLDVVVRCAELHDIGKMAIPDEIIHRAGPLTDDEWDLIRKHTLIGERILSVTPALREVARLVRSSHERWDGSGYPDGLAGTAIPLGSRITLICDAFDTMTGARPYDPPRTVEAAVAELRDNAGTQFDPELVALFCDELLPSFEADRAAGRS